MALAKSPAVIFSREVQNLPALQFDLRQGGENGFVHCLRALTCSGNDERSLIGQVVLAQAQAPQHRALSDNLSQGITYIDHIHNRATVYHYHQLSPRQQVIAKLAAQVASNHATDKPVETNYELQSSLREEEVLEIVEIAALFHYTNRLNRALGFVPTQPLVKQTSPHIVPDPLPYFYEGA